LLHAEIVRAVILNACLVFRAHAVQLNKEIPMRTWLLAAGLVVAAHSPYVLAAGMKAGLWEMKTLKQVVDGRDLLAQMAASQAQMQQAMAGMPAAQRKQMEAMMGNQGVAMPQAGVVRICVSPEMAARDQPVVDAEGRCQPSKLSRSGNRTHFEFDCKSEGRHMVGKGDSTVSGNSVQSQMDMTMSDAQGRHSMQTESRMTWLGSDCKGVKPADQLARELSGAARRK
jgi:hypothetical protein